jgi:hypothetical protein
MSIPPYLSNCDPENRLFPEDWKWEYYCLHGGIDSGYTCPQCKRLFTGPGRGGFAELHGDHRIAWSQGGRTVWETYSYFAVHVTSPNLAAKPGQMRHLAAE